MLELIVGRDRKRNTAAVLDRIAKAVEDKRGGQILIVPEQFSHDAERELCARCGDSASLYAEVLSFTRLADRVFSEEGGVCRETLDDGGRFTALTLALEQAQPRLKVYAPARTRPELIVRMAAQIEEFKNYGVSGRDLLAASGRFEGAFAQKLEELGLILESYDAVCAAGKADPSNKLERLRDLIWETDYIQNKTIYIDGFTDFTGLQSSILEQLLRLERRVSVTLALDDVSQGAMVFDTARETAKWLLRAAKGGEVSIYRQEQEKRGPAAFLRDHLFSYDMAQTGEAETVAVCRAGTPEEECAAAAAEIRRLMMAGFRCRDIAVACTDRAVYVPLLRPLLDRCGIPAYYTGREDILREPALRAVLSALRGATGGMEQEDVFSFLKSPLSPLDPDAVDLLQNYAETWRIAGSRWQKEFTMHPDGYGREWDEESRTQLRALNGWREAAAGPLLRLKAGLEQAANTKGQVLALYAFLQEIEARQRLERLTEVRELTDQRAQELGQLYDICLSAMEQLALVLGETVRTPEDFTTMLRQLLGQYSLGTIPAQLDSVTVGELPSLRYRHPRALLVLGAGDGQLPKFSADGSLLTDQEKILLKNEAEITLAPDKTGRMERELAAVHDVLCCGAERLFLSYAGETPSYLVRRILLLYPSVKEQQPALPLLTDDRAAGGYLASCSEDDALAARLRALGRQNLLREEAAVRDRAGYTLGRLSPEGVETLYHKTISLSASKIDRFSACRCAYFLEYGLRARERKEAGFDAPIFGTFVHYVLEKTAKRVEEEGGFQSLTDRRVQEIATEQIVNFTAVQIGAISEQEPRFRYLYERNLTEIREVVDELARELRRSAFVPSAYELDFGPGGSLPAIEVEGKNGCARVTGFVDRVDLFHAKEADYVRVVDYKTGKKDFSYADILDGMGMQMLIYLFALEQYGEKLWGRNVKPAGVLYFPARVPTIPMSDRPTDEEAAEERRKTERRSGLLLNDERLLRAMEDFEEQPVFLPCRIGKDGMFQGDLATAEEMRLLRNHVRETLGNILDAILEGDVHPNPYFRGSERSACRFCPFGTVCHLDSCDPELRYFAEKKAKEFWKRLGEKDHG